jgi:hypothetical protein
MTAEEHEMAAQDLLTRQLPEASSHEQRVRIIAEAQAHATLALSKQTAKITADTLFVNRVA